MSLTVDVLPRSFAEAGAVPMKLKRRMGDVNDYVYDKIRPHRVHEALDYLTQQVVYTSEGIRRSEAYNNFKPEDTIPFTLGDKDINCGSDEIEEQLSNDKV